MTVAEEPITIEREPNGDILIQGVRYEESFFRFMADDAVPNFVIHCSLCVEDAKGRPLRHFEVRLELPSWPQGERDA